MNHQTDFCILGAGLAGLSLADALQEHGLSVIIIDKKSIGAGASGTPGGLVNPATGRRGTKSWKAEQCYEAIAANLEKIQKTSSETFYLKNGLLRPALLEKMARKMKEQHEKTSWPEGWCEWKTEGEIKEIHPGIKCVDGGYWLPIGLSVDVSRYLKAYADYLENLGVTFFFNQEPKVINDGKAWKLESGGEIINSKNLIFATGHNSGDSPFWNWLPLHLIKGQVAKFKIGDKPLSFSHSISSLGYIALTGEKDTFVQGSTYEHNFDDLKPDQEGETYLRKRMRRTLPQLEEKATVVEQWAGVRTSTPDRKPVLGRHPDHENLHIFTGLGSKGLLYSKFLADHYAKHLTDGIDLFPEISINRFLNNVSSR
jgi:glycine/D-amino acid oxidase-like deaminating enzyme